MTEYSELDVYFHRLAPGRPSDDVLKQLYEDNYVLCHYENRASFDETDYTEQAAALDDIKDLADEGGICLVQLDAECDGYDRGRKLGVVPPGTDPVFIGAKKDSTITKGYTDQAEARSELEQNSKIAKIYKGVQLQEAVRELEADEYLLSAYEPPSTTFSSWYVVEEQIRAFLNKESLPVDEPTSYSPRQSELLAAEYLRTMYEYYPMIAPGGSSGTNQSFDLIGGIGDRSVFGEVKNIKGVSTSALDDLEEEAAEKTETFYFTRNPVDQGI